MNKIKEMWNERARKFKDSYEAGSNDFFLKQLEQKSILKYLKGGKRILDMGCGNGITTFEIAKLKDVEVVGADYSEGMVEQANEKLKKEKVDNIRFEVKDFLEMDYNEEFDFIVTDRAVQNLMKNEEQITALKNIHKALHKNGIYIMCEHIKEGHDNLNKIRSKFGLPKIKMPWHNKYMENEVLDFAKKIFKLERIDSFSSTYTLISKIVYAKYDEGKELKYDHKLNEIGSQLDSYGDFGSLKIFVFKKI